MLLLTAAHHCKAGFDKPTPFVTLRSITALAPEHGVLELPLLTVIRRFNSLYPYESPRSLLVNDDFHHSTNVQGHLLPQLRGNWRRACIVPLLLSQLSLCFKFEGVNGYFFHNLYGYGKVANDAALCTILRRRPCEVIGIS